MIKTFWINTKGTDEAECNIMPVSSYECFEGFNNSVPVAALFASSLKEKSRSSLRWRLILR